MLKVLVVEDEEMVRRGIVLTVDWACVGCVVVGEAADGEAGLELAARYQPNLIVTDIKMPRMGGVEMVEKLRQKGDNAYVIFLTAYEDFAYARSAVKLGAVDYLLKPFHDGELEEVVKRIQLRERENHALHGPAAPKEGSPENLRDKSKYVMEALNYIAGHYNDPEVSVSSIARNLGVSESHLSHVFKKETSYTLTGYLTSYRMHKAMELLKDCRSRVYEVAEQVGYRDIAYFSGAFKKSVGMSPSEYQRRSQ